MLTTTIEKYLSTRRANGFKLKNYEYNLRRFADFSIARGDDHIRTETVIAWVLQMNTPKQKRLHFQRIAQVARYLHAEDPQHEIPSNFHFPALRQRPVPYIYTTEEARRLIEVATQIGPANSIRPHVVSTVLALIFATGLRISEALALRMTDLTSDGLIIRHTKFGKTRLIPLHLSAQRGLNQYLIIRRAITDNNDHLFISTKKTRLSYGGFRKAWYAVLKVVDLPKRLNGRNPRLHDIRHTFAVRALESSPERRDQVARHMLAVSTYLGHSCVSDTYWYLQSTSKLMSQIADSCQKNFEGELI